MPKTKEASTALNLMMLPQKTGQLLLNQNGKALAKCSVSAIINRFYDHIKITSCPGYISGRNVIILCCTNKN
jgi:hypothetical protein